MVRKGTTCSYNNNNKQQQQLQQTTLFIMLYLWHIFVYSVHLQTVVQRRSATNPQTKSANSAASFLLSSSPTIAIHFYDSTQHLLFVPPFVP